MLQKRYFSLETTWNICLLFDFKQWYQEERLKSNCIKSIHISIHIKIIYVAIFYFRCDEREELSRSFFFLPEKKLNGNFFLQDRLFVETCNGKSCNCTRSKHSPSSSYSQIPFTLMHQLLYRVTAFNSIRKGCETFVPSFVRSLFRFPRLRPDEFIIIKTVSLRVRSVYNRLIILKVVYLADYLHYNES